MVILLSSFLVDLFWAKTQESINFFCYGAKVIQKPTDKLVMKNTTWLSKSKIKSNQNCLKMGFLELNNPKDKVWDKSMESRFVQGRAVEAIARGMFPEAVLQDKIKNEEKIAYTQELLKTHSTILEASFSYHDTIVQFDVLSKQADGTYHAAEVKSATSFKDEYETDVLIQYWVTTLSSDIKISKFEVWVVNTQSTSKDDYFTKFDATEIVLNGKQRFLDMLERAEETRMLKITPDIKPGSFCDQLECPFRHICLKGVGEAPDSVLNLPNFKGWAAQDAGITSVISDAAAFDAKYKYAEKYPLVIKSLRENRLVIEQDAVNAAIGEWTNLGGVHFFDFETLQSAIPVLENQKPYEQVVVQFSNHLWIKGESKLKHSQYIHTDKSNPGLGAIKAILETLGNDNYKIVCWNMTFEKTMIRNLAKSFPEFSEQLLAIVDRIVDLMVVVKNHVYHPEFMGSYSLKFVSPALLKEYGNYSNSVIKSGSEIANNFMEMIESSDSARKEEIYSNLATYCAMDTLNLYTVMSHLLDQNFDIVECIRIHVEEAA